MPQWLIEYLFSERSQSRIKRIFQHMYLPMYHGIISYIIMIQIKCTLYGQLKNVLYSNGRWFFFFFFTAYITAFLRYLYKLFRKPVIKKKSYRFIYALSWSLFVGRPAVRIKCKFINKTRNYYNIGIYNIIELFLLIYNIIK